MELLDSTEWMLILVCLLGSLISVSIGTSCGLLLAAMVTVLPPSAALPLHGLIEGLSSGIRWAILRRHVDYLYLSYFAAGGLLGLLAGWPLIGFFSEQTLTLVLGLFLLLTLWVPLAWLSMTGFFGGAVTSCLTLLVGATGPLVAAVLARGGREHRSVVATQGACTVFQHWGKVIVFSASGFSFSHYWELIVALCLATIAGTVSGKYLLSIIPVHYLKLTLRTLVSLLGVRLVMSGLNITLNVPPVSTGIWLVVAFTVAISSGFLGYKLGYRRGQNS